MTRLRFLRWLPFLAAIAAGALLLGRRGKTNEPLPQTAPESTIDPAREDLQPSEDGSAAPVRYTIRPGRILSYDLKLRHRVDMGVTSPSAEKSSMRLLLSGLLVSVDYAPRSPDEWIQGYRLERASLHQVGRASSRGAERLSQEISEEMLVTRTAQGKITRFYFPQSWSPTARNLMKSFLLSVQFPLPFEPGPAWTLQEEDMTGRFSADYVVNRGRASGGRSVARIRRTKVRYEPARTERSPFPEGRVRIAPRGFAWGDLDLRKGYLSAARINESVTMTGLGLVNEIRVEIQGRMDLVREESSRIATSRRLDLHCPSRPSDFEGAGEFAETERRARRAELAKGHTLTGVLQMMRGFSAEGTLNQGPGSLAVARLAAILALEEESVAEVLHLLRQNALPPEVQNYVAGALGSAGTPAAQKALAEIVRDPDLAPGLRTSGLVALAAPSHPTAEAEGALRDLAKESGEYGLGRNAALILGVMAHRLRGRDRGDDIARFLLAQEARLRSEGAVGIFLEAIGNSGHPRAYRALVPYLTEEEESVRAAAVSSLRRMTHESVEAHLEKALNDPSPLVRAAALETAAFRIPSGSLLNRVKEVAMNDREERVRSLAKGVLENR